MIGSNSRYAGLEIATLAATRNGLPTEIRYLRRRFIPRPASQVTLILHSVKQGDRLDNITTLYFNDPTLFWRLCDANAVLRPTELTDTLGRLIDVALPLLPGAG
jgi:hypothetical protein